VAEMKALHQSLPFASSIDWVILIPKVLTQPLVYAYRLFVRTLRHRSFLDPLSRTRPHIDTRRLHSYSEFGAFDTIGV